MQIRHHEPVKVHDCFISYMLEISHAEDESTGLDLDLGVESYHDLVTQYSSSMEEEEQVAHDGGDKVHQQAAHAAEMRCTGGSR